MMNLTLIEEIKKAFETVEYPGDMNLVKDIQHPDSYEMFEAFKGKRWQEVDIKQAEYWRMNLPLFTPLGFQYYLPAFLIAALDEEPTEIDVYIVNVLEPSKEISRHRCFLEQISMLNNIQKSVIYKFLQLFFTENPNLMEEKESILSFWRPETD